MNNSVDHPLRQVALTVTLLAVMTFTAAPVFAQNVALLAPPYTGAETGNSVDLDLKIDFSDAVLGGGLVIQFDAAHLSYQSFDFDPGFPDDPALRLVCPSAAPACVSFPGPGVLVAFAVDTLSLPAISGPHTVGTFSFNVLATSASNLTLGEDDSVAGPLVGEASFAPASFLNATVGPPLGVPGLALLGLMALASSLALAGARLARGQRALLHRRPVS